MSVLGWKASRLTMEKSLEIMDSRGNGNICRMAWESVAFITVMTYDWQMKIGYYHREAISHIW